MGCWMGEAENRSAGNLVVLCIVHADLIDQREHVAQRLREWKSAQIAAYKRAVEAGHAEGWQLTDDQAAEVVEQSERKVLVRVHRAFFEDPHRDKRQQFCIWVTNLSPQRIVEITHIWFETNPPAHILNPERPLPKRLQLDERWETWIPVADVPAEDDLDWKVRVSLSNDEVVKSLPNPNVPSRGFVAGP
jgi:hypothetical protein